MLRGSEGCVGEGEEWEEVREEGEGREMHCEGLIELTNVVRFSDHETPMGNAEKAKEDNGL